jgi:myosin heavy subunit
MIKHYAEDVVYEIEGWMQKNKDTLQEDVTKSMLTSSNPFIAALFVVCKWVNGSEGNGKGGGRRG